MSSHPSEPAIPAADRKPMTIPRFVSAKREGRRLTVLTAYDHLWAGLLDEAGVDAILVGDSLGMVVQGRNTTLPVTLDQMIYHAEMVVRAVKRALVIVDLPFLSFQVSIEETLRNAGRVLKETGASAVKLESGVNQAATIRALAEADIPVMAHVGMRPQSVLKLGGYRVQRDEERLLAEARVAAEAGAFGIVLECIPGPVAARITAESPVPTIGIGAGPHCDGQVLVTPDLVGLTPGQPPKFVQPFANLRQTVQEAVTGWATAVRAGTHPDAAHTHS
ncbi:MAG: 3-methyl-2-oxobutanoate hydroxymethyltransferase [Planctomycetaceae bacterium]